MFTRKTGGGDKGVGAMEKILDMCDQNIERVEKSNFNAEMKESALGRNQAIKEVIETVCGIHGATPFTAIRILEDAEAIINEAIMNQKFKIHVRSLYIWRWQQDRQPDKEEGENNDI